jgi:DNA polymerase-1
LGNHQLLPRASRKILTEHVSFIRKFKEIEPESTPRIDIIKVAMLKIDRALQAQKLKSRMIMQVHDELVFEAAENEIDDLKEMVIKEMESAASLKVPLKVDIGIGNNWLEAH